MTRAEIENAIADAGLSEHAICLHSSLSSFGFVEGGAITIVESFLNSGCTLLVPTFSWGFAVPCPVDQRIPQNGWDYENYAGPVAGINRIYTTQTDEIDKEMGAIPAAVVNYPNAKRGNHPICSFAAVGPLAQRLIEGQRPDDVYAPFQALAEVDGTVVLAGLSINSMTLIHLAEREAGRNLFRRFANDLNGQPIAVEVGGCSDGFLNFYSVLQDIYQTEIVGQSRWHLFPARQTLHRLTDAIRSNPMLTHCGEADCERCNDAILGGAILSNF